MAAKKNVWTEEEIKHSCLLSRKTLFSSQHARLCHLCQFIILYYFLVGHQWFLWDQWGAGAHPRVQSRNTHRRGHLPITGHTHDLPMDWIPRGNSVPRLLQPLFRPLHHWLLCPLWVGLMFLGPHFTFPLEGQCRCKVIRCRITFKSLQGQRCCVEMKHQRSIYELLKLVEWQEMGQVQDLRVKWDLSILYMIVF